MVTADTLMTDRRHNMIKQVLAQILIHINKCRKRSPERESSRTFTCRTVEWCFLKRTVLCLHCVSKNAKTLPGCSFDNRGLILISFDKQHDQHTFKNDMHFQVSLSLQFYLLYLLFSRRSLAAMEMTRNNVFFWADCWWL